MALKPVIYRARISLNDIDHDKYDTFNLTLALHPSETIERMMMRLVAYCLNFQEFLTFTKGLSDPDQPDIIAQSMDDETVLWIDMGEPSAERIKKATRKARQVKVYSFNEKSDIWWASERKKAAQYPAEVYQFSWKDAAALADLVERTMDISMTITGFSAYITIGNGEREIHWKRLE
jgi:uncharacterized protein YaeQ